MGEQKIKTNKPLETLDLKLFKINSVAEDSIQTYLYWYITVFLKKKSLQKYIKKLSFHQKKVAHITTYTNEGQHTNQQYTYQTFTQFKNCLKQIVNISVY